MGIMQEFRDFALKSNFMDMATGIVIGAATTSVVNSLVEDIIMPPIGLATGGVDFSKLALILQEKTPDADAVAINYGAFINATISFVIIMFAVFMLIKAYNSAKAKFEEEQEAAPAAPPKQEVLLTEIRDAIRASNS